MLMSAYEAGFSGFWAKRKLTELGIDTIVVHPADIPTTDKDRDQKSDQRDSRKISTSLRSGELRGVKFSRWLPIESSKDNCI